MKASWTSACWLGGLVMASACASDNAGGGSGGTPAAGGTSAAGGASATSSGGTTASGGTSGGAGGAPATGGAAGMTGAGGAPSTGGGMPAAGGSLAGGANGMAGAGGTPLDAGSRDTEGEAGSPDAGRDARADASLGDATTPEASQDATPPGDTPVGRTSTCVGPASAALANAWLPDGYCAWTWASNLSSPRGIARNAAGDVLVVEQSGGRIVLLHDDNGNGVSDSSERVVLATSSGLNHGIAVHDGYLYASSATTVYRWAYSGGRQPLGSPQTVVTGIPGGGHSTRTLLFDTDGNLLVSVGSASNIDTNIVRSRIIRYPASGLGSASTFDQGEAFATGLRNEVGLALDGQGRVWGVENGSDNLSRSDLGGDIHNDNPGEELNLFTQPGRFYGYPYCWSEYSLPSGRGLGRGAQWADPSTMNDGTHDDAWCRSSANVVGPALVMQAHSAPLDIKFYAGAAFPPDMHGTAIVTFHGSWNRSPATGYKVVRIPFGADGMPSGDPTPLLEFAGSGDQGAGWPHRPVGIETGLDGRLFITSDASDVVIAIGHDGR